MTVSDFRAFREMRDGCFQAAAAADLRGDTAYATGCRAAAADLMDQVPPPELIPNTFEGLLNRYAQADAMTVRAAHRTKKPYQIVSRQADFARRLRLIIDRSNKA